MVAYRAACVRVQVCACLGVCLNMRHVGNVRYLPVQMLQSGTHHGCMHIEATIAPHAQLLTASAQLYSAGWS